MHRFLALGLALAAMLLSGCGSSNPHMIDQTRAEALSATVDQIAQRTDAEDCEGAQGAVREAKNQVSELPKSVDSRLKGNLTDWLDHIAVEVPKDCKPKAEKTPTTTPTPTPTETDTPTPTPTETDTPTPTPTPTPTETPPPVPTGTPTVQPPAGGGVIPGNEG